MCDYSFEGLESRDAQVGDQLVTARLGEFDCIGLVSPNQPDVAVCMLPGSCLKVTGGVSAALQGKLHISLGDRATFLKRDLPAGRSDYQDSLHFDCHVADATILFQELPAGLQFEVLSIPTDQADAPAAAARERVLEPA